MLRYFRLDWLTPVLLLSLMTGCGETKRDFVRDPVSKVTGTLLIDGQPEKEVAVRLARVDGPDESAGTSMMLTPSAMTDDKGKFSIGTYDKGPAGDGAPDGEYVVIFQWGKMSPGARQYQGDKFKGKYANPKKSEHTLTVAGKPVDLGTIELSTK